METTTDRLNLIKCGKQDCLSDYLLMRCFDQEEYLNSFINGSCLHMNNVQLFRDISNSFQGDPNDCAVIVDGENLPGYICAGNDRPETLLSKSDLNVFNIYGYIYCFFALKKAFFDIKDGNLMYDADSPYAEKFFRCLDEYIANSKTGSCYVGIFDAATLVRRLNSALDKLDGVHYVNGFVNYQKLNSLERMALLSSKNDKQIVLTKDPDYSYQSEFRYFISTPRYKIDQWLRISGIDFSDIVAVRFKYNSK